MGSNLKAMALVAVLGSVLLGSCAGSTTSLPAPFVPGPSGGDGNDTPPTSGSDGPSVIGGGGDDTGLNLPGSGGAGHGASYVPTITVPGAESFSNDAPAGTDDVQAWLINCVETLPDGRSGVFQNESLQDWAYAIFDGCNEARAANGLAPMQYEPHLEVLAQAHARDMGLRDYFSHDCPDGVLMWDRWQAFHVPYTNWAGENAAMGQETAQEVVQQWLSSPGHRRNLLNAQAEFGGVGVYFDAGSSMPIKVIMEYANFRDDPATNDWYDRGDVYR